MLLRVHSRRSVWCGFFFFQAEDGIRDLVRSRGLGDVYKRQDVDCDCLITSDDEEAKKIVIELAEKIPGVRGIDLSLIHI